MDLLNEIVKEIGSDYAKIASDKEDKEQYIDTGSYVFNGLVSGSIFGGVSSNRITAIAGETSTGKTYFSLAVVKNFLDNNPNGYVLYFDTESAVNRELLETRNIDTRRVGHIEVVTVEEFRNKALKALDIYLDKPTEDQLAAQESAGNTEEANNVVRATRKAAYGDIGDQLDEIYKDIDAWKTRIKAIKDANPKS